MKSTLTGKENYTVEYHYAGTIMNAMLTADAIPVYFDVGRLAVLIVSSYGYWMRLPPAVIRTQLRSFF